MEPFTDPKTPMSTGTIVIIAVFSLLVLALIVYAAKKYYENN